MDLYEIFFIPTLPGITLKLMEQPVGGGERGRGFPSSILQEALSSPTFWCSKRVLRMHLTLSVTSECDSKTN